MNSYNNTDIITSQPFQQTTKQLFTPTIQLTSHKTEIYSGKFSTDGELYATGGGDGEVFIWSTFDPQCKCISHLQTAHAGMILNLRWNKHSNNNYTLYTVSTDKTMKIWDIYTSSLIKKYKQTSSVNCIDVYNDNLITTGNDNCILSLYDTKMKEPIVQVKTNFQINSLAFNYDGSEIFIAGNCKEIECFNIHKQSFINDIYSFKNGHHKAITDISLSHSGNYLLSNSMDNSLIIWDVRPFVIDSSKRNIMTLKGNKHSFENNLLRCVWNKDDSMVSCGSADKIVRVWDVDSGNILYELPGHMGSVNEVDFNSVNDNIIASVSSDHTSIIGYIFN